MQHGYRATGKRLLLIGYFGYGNMGDEAALLEAVRYLTEAGFSVTVSFSGRGDFSLLRELGASDCPRYSPRALLRAIDDCDAVVFSGGNHFERESSRRSLVYYSIAAIAAQARGKPTLMLASGLGSMRGGIDGRIARVALRRFSFAGLRTEGDLQEASDLFRCELFNIPDLAFALPTLRAEKERAFAIIPRRDSAAMLKEARALRALGLTPVVIPLFASEDARAARGFGEALGCEVFVSQNTNEIRERIAKMSICLTERLHGAVFAVTASTPFIMGSDAKKCKRFSAEVEKRARKLNTPSPFIKNTEHFLRYLEGEPCNFSALCQDFSRELSLGLQCMLLAASGT